MIPFFRIHQSTVKYLIGPYVQIKLSGKQTRWLMEEWLRTSKYTVVFTGAGMSTESGLADFRSPSGLWAGKDPQKLASVSAMNHRRKEFIEFYRMRIEKLQDIQPHIGYGVLKKWGQSGLVKSIITQNTDGLHEKAGNPQVIPLHGTIQKLHCENCGVTYSSDHYLNNTDCYKCGGFLRPSVVLFGELLDSSTLIKAEKEAHKANLFIMLGSSLVVSPANTLPLIAKRNGAKLVIVNMEDTPLDKFADLVIHGRKITDVLAEISI